jgi:hypothetical protein
MSCTPASWSDGDLAEIRTRWWAAYPKTVATDPFDFGSVAIGQIAGYYLGKALIHGRVGRSGIAALTLRRGGMRNMAGASAASRAGRTYSDRKHRDHRGSSSHAARPARVTVRAIRTASLRLNGIYRRPQAIFYQRFWCRPAEPGFAALAIATAITVT